MYTEEQAPVELRYLWLEGILSPDSFNFAKKGLPHDIPHNGRTCFVGYCYADIPLPRTYDLIFNFDHPEQVWRTQSRIVAATQQWAKPFEELPHGWKTVCVIEFPDDALEIIDRLPLVDGWFISSFRLGLCDQRNYPAILRGLERQRRTPLWSNPVDVVTLPRNHIATDIFADPVAPDARERHHPTGASMPPLTPTRFETGRPMLLGGLRRRHDFAAAAEGIVRQWQEFLAGAELPGRTGTGFYGVMCGADETGIEYMCGVEVESLENLPKGAGRMRVFSRQYAVFAHHGPAQALQSTWQGILAWLEQGEYMSAHQPDFELYGPGVDPLTASDGIEVWIGVVPRSDEMQ
jgi:predicted transcriptional regulator YdeE